MFHFPWFARSPLCIQDEVTDRYVSWVSPFGNLWITVRLATPQSLSQPPTSFIASQRLGIHHTPLVAYLPQSLSRPSGFTAGWVVETRDQGPDPCSSQRTRKNHFICDSFRLPTTLIAELFSAEIEFYPSYALVKERNERHRVSR